MVAAATCLAPQVSVWFDLLSPADSRVRPTCPTPMQPACRNDAPFLPSLPAELRTRYSSAAASGAAATTATAASAPATAVASAAPALPAAQPPLDTSQLLALAQTSTCRSGNGPGSGGLRTDADRLQLVAGQGQIDLLCTQQ